MIKTFRGGGGWFVLPRFQFHKGTIKTIHHNLRVYLYAISIP